MSGEAFRSAEGATHVKHNLFRERAMSKMLGALAAVLVTAGVFWAGTAAVAQEKPSVGLVLVGPKNDGGWSMRHHQGFEALQKYGYEAEVVESVPEADSQRVFTRLARKHDVVVGTSFGFMDPMVAAAERDRGDTIFLHASGYKTIEGKLDVYHCRLYQARYLTGIAAGMLTRTNKIGFVGSYPIPEIVQNINAAALGARSVNPAVEINVVWINSWFDPPKDMDAAKAMLEWGADVLYTTTDSPNVVTLAQQQSTPEKPLWSMGNDAPMNAFGPDRYATGAMFNWNVFYKYKLDQIAEGNFKLERSFWGLQENCVGLSPWGPNVPGAVVNKVETVKMEWINDQMDADFPFSAGFTKQDGTRVPAGEVGRSEIEQMQYFVEGVVAEFPTR